MQHEQLHMTQDIDLQQEIAEAIVSPQAFSDSGEIERMFTWLRSNQPLGIARPKGVEPFWVVTKHADVLEVTRRNDLYDSTTKPFILGEIEAIERMRAINDGDAFPFKSLTGTDERSEEHTSELQSLMRISYAVFCLKKKKKDNKPQHLDDINNK